MLTSASLSVGTRSIVALFRVKGDKITRFFSDVLPMVSGEENLMVSRPAIFSQSKQKIRPGKITPSSALSPGGRCGVWRCGHLVAVVSCRNKDCSFSPRRAQKYFKSLLSIQKQHHILHFFPCNTSLPDWLRLVFRPPVLFFIGKNDETARRPLCPCRPRALQTVGGFVQFILLGNSHHVAV